VQMTSSGFALIYPLVCTFVPQMIYMFSRFKMYFFT